MDTSQPPSSKKRRLDTRARQRLELLALRSENEDLLGERVKLLEQIRSLERASKPQTGRPEEMEVAAENDLLRTELEQHKQLMKSFNALLGEQPVSLEAEHVIYGEGAEAAYSYVLGLVSQSKSWKVMQTPSSLVFPLLDTQFSFKFQKDLFGFGQKTGSMRVNIRVDGMLPNMQLDAPGDALWKVFSQHDYMSRMFNLNETELLPVHQMPGSNTKVVRFRSRQTTGQLEEGEQDIVFICNRREQEIAKSTLAPPGKRKLLSSESEFGSVKATILSVMSTSLHSRIDDAQLKSMKVVKGAILWQEEASVRLTVLYSVPEEFRLMKKLNFHDLVTSNDAMSNHFATLLQEVGGEFVSLVEETATNQKQDA